MNNKNNIDLKDNKKNKENNNKEKKSQKIIKEKDINLEEINNIKDLVSLLDGFNKKVAERIIYLTDQATDDLLFEVKEFKKSLERKMAYEKNNNIIKIDKIFLKFLDLFDTLFIIKTNIIKNIEINKYDSKNYIMIIKNAIMLLYDDFLKYLKNYNIDLIEIKINKTLYDSNLHRVISFNDENKNLENNVIIAELKKGFINIKTNKILRKSFVILNKKSEKK